ncbi:MAG: hypothetical protein ACO2ZZ_05435 [Cyclobacteriaceae bacterium]
MNKNGHLQLEDFTDKAEKICDKLEYEHGGKHHEFLVRQTVALFHRLLTDILHPDK